MKLYFQCTKVPVCSSDLFASRWSNILSTSQQGISKNALSKIHWMKLKHWHQYCTYVSLLAYWYCISCRVWGWVAKCWKSPYATVDWHTCDFFLPDLHAYLINSLLPKIAPYECQFMTSELYYVCCGFFLSSCLIFGFLSPEWHMPCPLILCIRRHFRRAGLTVRTPLFFWKIRLTTWGYLCVYFAWVTCWVPINNLKDRTSMIDTGAL